MSYNANIPQATDNPSQSQSQLLANFQEISTMIQVNHTGFGAGEGQHLFLGMVDNTGSLPTQPTGTTLNVYNAQDAQSVNQLYLQGPAATQFATAFPFTQHNAASGGWTYLASSIKMAWASVAIGNGATVVALNTALFGTNFPGFTTAFNAQLTLGNNVLPGTAYMFEVSALTNTDITITSTISAGTANCYILVIGN